jgi:hypothetical protein
MAAVIAEAAALMSSRRKAAADIHVLLVLETDGMQSWCDV